MPDSMRMKLDHIKRYLDEGKAAALIGAGFSKNAKIPEAAENYVVSNAKIKAALGMTEMLVRAKDGLRETIKSFAGK